MAVKIVTDSTSYIDPATLKDLDIKIVPLSVHFPDASFDETKVAYDFFYRKIEKDNLIPTSSQPTLQEIYNTFKAIVERGEEVLGIFISAKMSGTFEAALMAKKMLLEEYPKAGIEVINSKTNCMALGIQVIEAAIAAKANKKMHEVVETAQHILEKVRFYFVPSTLQYLIKGGRIGGAAALIGSLLQIRPILFVNDGMTDVFERVRGTQKAVNRMLNILQEDVEKYGLGHLLVHHINAPQQGHKLADKLQEQYAQKVPVLPIGPVIGLHVGPGALAIVYTTEE